MLRSRNGRIGTVTAAFFVVEWLLFELIRVPYNPPHDMLTFLGQEKYSVIGFMGMIAIGWLLYMLCDGLWPLPTMRQGFAFAALLCALIAVLAWFVSYPPWTVTPLNLLLD